MELTKEECLALYEIIDQLSGGSPENIFAWDGTDTLDDPTTSAAVKLFRAVNKRIPENLL